MTYKKIAIGIIIKKKKFILLKQIKLNTRKTFGNFQVER